jgi:hypothetical protein
MSAKNDEATYEGAVAITLAAFAGAEIFLVLYITMKEIFKKTGDSYVIKDQYTIYFVTLLVIGLTFKMLIVDSYIKKEIQSKNTCSMFLSTFVPDFFVALAYACLMIKSFLILKNVKDTK